MLESVFEVFAILFVNIGTVLFLNTTSPVVHLFGILIAIIGGLYILKNIKDLKRENDELAKKLREQRKKLREERISDSITKYD